MKIKFAVFTITIALIINTAQADSSKAAVCTACHGATGNSINPIWPSLAGQGAEYMVQQLKAFKSKTRNNAVMWPFANSLSDKDMWTIAVYYSKQKSNIMPSGSEQNPIAERLYRGGDLERGIPACMACHGPAGAGNSPAKYPALRGQNSPYTKLQLKDYRTGNRKHPMMEMIAQKLTDEDIEILSTYVSALY